MNKCLRPGLAGWQYWNPKSLRAGAGVEFWLQEAETYLMELSFTHRSASACVFWTEEQWWKIQGESHLKILVSEWVSQSTSVVSDSLRPYRLYSPWHSPGQNTGLGSLSLLHGIFSTQESNPGLPHCRQIFYQLSRKGSPRILEWVAYPFSSGSSQSRNRTGVSHIEGRFFTNWAIRESLKILIFFKKGK